MAFSLERSSSRGQVTVVTDALLSRLLREASRQSRRADESDDLVQDVLLAAVAGGRDLADPGLLPWAIGAIRLRARHVARSAVRRKRRDTAALATAGRPFENPPSFPVAFLNELPPSLWTVALLVNLGMDRREIGHLTGITDVALRRRLSDLAARWREAALMAEDAPLTMRHADGMRRRHARRAASPLHPRAFAAIDPDGHIIRIAIAHKPTALGNSAGINDQESSQCQ